MIIVNVIAIILMGFNFATGTILKDGYDDIRDALNNFDYEEYPRQLNSIDKKYLALNERDSNCQCIAAYSEPGCRNEPSRATVLLSNGRCVPCGIRNYGNVGKRIIGGRPAEENEFPWHATIYNDDRIIGGGAIISPNLVITTAHGLEECFDREVEGRGCNDRWCLTPNYQVHLNYNDAPEYGIEVEQINCHENLKRVRPGLYRHDVALLKLKIPQHQAPLLCISNQCIFKPSQYSGCIGIGHGWLSFDNPEPVAELQKVNVDVLEFKECWRSGVTFSPSEATTRLETILLSRYVTQNHHICVRNSNTGRAPSCKIDSGSPVVCPKDPDDPKSSYVLIGLFSATGKNCDGSVSILTNLVEQDMSEQPRTWLNKQITEIRSNSCNLK